MADTQETIADIIAEMRNRAKRPDFVSQDVLKSCADRLDAARKREAAFHAMTCEANDRLREHLQIALDADKRERGDCAKLREACANIAAYARSAQCHATDAHILGYLSQIEMWACAALAAPMRNCDRFASAEEAWDAYDAWVESYRSKGKTEPYNEFGWLFAPATEQEGGAK